MSCVINGAEPFNSGLPRSSYTTILENVILVCARAGEPEPVGAGFFLLLGTGAARKKIAGAGAAWGKNQEPEPLEKKSGAGAAKKFASSPALVCATIYFLE